MERLISDIKIPETFIPEKNLENKILDLKKDIKSYTIKRFMMLSAKKKQNLIM